MGVFVDNKNIETDNLITSLYFGVNLGAVYYAYDKLDLKLDKEFEKLFKFIEESNKLDRKLLNKLFKHFTIKGSETNIFFFTFYWEQISFGKSFDEFLYYLENIDEDTVLKKIYFKLLKFQRDVEEIDIAEEKTKVEINDMLEILINLEVEAEFKWYLIEMCYDVKGFFCRCSEFLKQSRKVLEKKLAPFNERGRIWVEELNEKITKEGLAFVKEILQDFNEEKYENIFICPRIMDNYAFHYNESRNSKDIYMCCGENFEALIETFGKNNERLWIQNIFKYLSDGSRFKIMQLLKEKPMYASELAISLGISNATISHHTTLLFLVKLIEETKINNRSYMKISEDSIDTFVEVFKKEFNLEEGEKA